MKNGKLVFAVSGNLKNYTFQTLKDYIEKNGHVLHKEIRTDTSYLINNNTRGGDMKNIFAIQRNIPIIDEETVIRLLSNQEKKLNQSPVETVHDLIRAVNRSIEQFRNIPYKVLTDHTDQIKNEISWDLISRDCELSNQDLEKYDDFLNWDVISKYQDITLFDFDKYGEKINWHIALVENNLSIETIILNTKYFDECSWDVISKKYRLSSLFIRKFHQFLNWNLVSKYQRLSSSIIEEFASKLNWYLISKYQDISNLNSEIYEEFALPDIARKFQNSKNRLFSSNDDQISLSEKILLQNDNNEQKIKIVLEHIIKHFGMQATIDFGNNKKYRYNSNGYVKIGDKVKVFGKISVEGEVIQVSKGLDLNSYVQYIDNVVISENTARIGPCNLNFQLEQDNNLLLVLIEENLIDNINDVMTTLISFDDFWIEAARSIDYRSSLLNVLATYHDEFIKKYDSNEALFFNISRTLPWYLSFANDSIKANIDIVTKNLCNLEFGDFEDTLSEILSFHMNNRILAIVSVSIYGLILEKLNDEFKNDKDLVLKAVENNGLSLAFASDKLKNDYDVVLSAVKENGGSLVFASREMQKHQEILKQKSAVKLEKDTDISSTQIIDDFSIRFEDQKEAVIVKYLGKQKVVKIPDYIKGYRIYDIDYQAFSNNQYIETLICSNGLNYIGIEAFLNCTNLKEVVFSNSIYWIDQSAFEGCAIESVHLPDKMGFIRRRTFANNKSLRHVQFPKYLAYIDEEAFVNCPNLIIDKFDSEIIRIDDLAFDEHLKQFKTRNQKHEEAINAELENSNVKLVFVATGKFEEFTRDSLKSYIEEKGHALLEKISKSANYLINNDLDSLSSKNKYAKDNNIQIISEKDLIDLLEHKKVDINPQTRSDILIKQELIAKYGSVNGFELQDSKQIKFVVVVNSQHHYKWNEYLDEYYYLFDTYEDALRFSEDSNWEDKHIKIYQIESNDAINEEDISSECIEENGKYLHEIFTDGWISFSADDKVQGIINHDIFLGDIIDGKVTIYLKPDQNDLTEIIIPSRLCNTHQCFDVIKIKDNGFCNNEKLKKVVIEDGVIEIGKKAFENCTNLGDVKIPSSLKIIDDYAFLGCIYNLSESEHSNGFSNMGDNEIQKNDENANQVQLMGNETHNYVFAATGKFEQFTRESMKTFIESKGYSLLDKISKNADYLINNDISSESSKNKFAKENNIPIITEKDLIKLLSSNLSEVSDNSQKEQSNKIDSSKVIETTAKSNDFDIYLDKFTDASGIKKSQIVEFAERSKKVLLLSDDGLTVRKIRKDNKNHIIIIPEGVETIAKEAFKDNEVVEYILLPKSLRNIENYAFSKCTKLSYVGVPNVELSFGAHTFSGCKSLKMIDFPDDAILGESTFEQTGLESITCKSKYDRIPRRCFSDNESLIEVTIPNNIKELASKAFSGCTQLKRIHVSKSVEKMGEDVFDTCLELKITSEHSSKPVGWNEHWNPMYRPIAWGYLKDSEKDPVYKQEGKPPKIIYIVAMHFGGANVQIIYTEDNVEVKDRVCIKGTTKCGKVLSKKPASSQRYIRENQKLVEINKA